jgi:hypothetical protein
LVNIILLRKWSVRLGLFFAFAYPVKPYAIFREGIGEHKHREVHEKFLKRVLLKYGMGPDHGDEHH